MYLVVENEEAVREVLRFVEGRLRIAVQRLPSNSGSDICLQLRPEPAQRAVAEEFHSFLKLIRQVV